MSKSFCHVRLGCGETKNRVGRLRLNFRVCQAILPRLVLDVLC